MRQRRQLFCRNTKYLRRGVSISISNGRHVSCSRVVWDIPYFVLTYLDMKRIAAKFVPKQLSDKQKEN